MPIHLLNAAYGMKIKRELDVSDSPDRPPTPYELLAAYCAVKGYITNGTGRWDEFRACKDMLRDFTDGNILYVATPPGVSIDMPRWLQDTESVMIKREKVAKRVAVARLKQVEEEEVNKKREEAEERNEVFGEGNYTHAEGEFSEVGSEEGEEEVVKRQHTRLRQWGKKNKKLRNRTPYAEDDPYSFVAYSTNRGLNKLVKGQLLSEDKVKRRDVAREYGTVFVGIPSLIPQRL